MTLFANIIGFSNRFITLYSSSHRSKEIIDNYTALYESRTDNELDGVIVRIRTKNLLTVGGTLAQLIQELCSRLLKMSLCC